MPVRQVQAHEIPRHHVRKVRRRGYPVESTARTHGPHRIGRASRPHLVPQVPALAYRAGARHDAQGSRAGALFRELRGHRARIVAAEAESAAVRGGVSRGPGRIRRGRLHRRHRRQRDSPDACIGRSRGRPRGTSHRACRNHVRRKAQEARQAAQVDRVLHDVGQPSGVDDSDRRSGDSAGPKAAGAARRRTLRHIGPQRPLPPGHQPQQPAKAPDGIARARHHHPQRNAYAARGSGRAF